MSVTRRHKFLSIEGSYHGNSLGALSVAASETRERFKNLLPNCRKIDCPLDGKAADRAEAILKRRDTAAFIMEPVICNLGVHVPTPLFMTRMQALCRKYGTLLVMDEVATGFGRTGRLFASEHFGLEPDILCLAKAVTGGYAPLGAAVVRGAVADAIDDRFSFYSTFGWHPVSVAAALASSRYFVAHREEILTNVNRLSDYFGTRLSAMKFEGLTALNIAGLAIALEFEDDDAAERIADRCRRKGLLVSDEGGDLMLLPALTMDRATARRGLDILEASL
jgi:adenosylmethionine-8-amino-7-oxononanoate aminotransferase